MSPGISAMTKLDPPARAPPPISTTPSVGVRVVKG
jgi:hypothetical protein